jgi:hypothetical protein
VNGSDYTLIDNAFNMQGPNLVTNPNSTPGAAGATASDGNLFHQSGVPIANANADPLVSATAQIAGTSVPEPASASLLLLAGASMLSRRSRRRLEQAI